MLEQKNFVVAAGPKMKNMTHIFAPLDLTVNRSMKQLERKEFPTYYSNCISEQLKSNPNRSIEEVVVDTKLSTVKPLHARTMAKAYDFFRSAQGRKIIASGWRAAGITEALKHARQGQLVDALLDPFASLSI